MARRNEHVSWTIGIESIVLLKNKLISEVVLNFLLFKDTFHTSEKKKRKKILFFCCFRRQKIEIYMREKKEGKKKIKS